MLAVRRNLILGKRFGEEMRERTAETWKRTTTLHPVIHSQSGSISNPTLICCLCMCRWDVRKHTSSSGLPSHHGCNNSALLVVWTYDHLSGCVPGCVFCRCGGPLVIPESRVQIRTIKYSGAQKEKRLLPERRYVNGLTQWEIGFRRQGRQAGRVPHVCSQSGIACASEKSRLLMALTSYYPCILRSRLSAIN